MTPQNLLASALNSVLQPNCIPCNSRNASTPPTLCPVPSLHSQWFSLLCLQISPWPLPSGEAVSEHPLSQAVYLPLVTGAGPLLAQNQVQARDLARPIRAVGPGTTVTCAVP